MAEIEQDAEKLSTNFKAGFKKHWQAYSIAIGVAMLVLTYLIYRQHQAGASDSSNSHVAPASSDPTQPIDTTTLGNTTPVDTSLPGVAPGAIYRPIATPPAIGSKPSNPAPATSAWGPGANTPTKPIGQPMTAPPSAPSGTSGVIIYPNSWGSISKLQYVTGTLGNPAPPRGGVLYT